MAETEQPKRMGAKPTITEAMFEAICASRAMIPAGNKASELHGVKYQTLMDTIRRKSAEGDLTWHERWEQAKDEYVDSLRLEAHQRAVEGWEEPVFGALPGIGAGSGVVGHKHVRDNNMLLKLLQAHAPEFKPRAEVAIVDDRPVGGMDIYTKLTLKAQKAIREIIKQDLEEQRLATAERVTVISQQALEGPTE